MWTKTTVQCAHFRQDRQALIAILPVIPDICTLYSEVCISLMYSDVELVSCALTYGLGHQQNIQHSLVGKNMVLFKNVYKTSAFRHWFNFIFSFFLVFFLLFLLRSKNHYKTDDIGFFVVCQTRTPEELTIIYLKFLCSKILHIYFLRQSMPA